MINKTLSNIIIVYATSIWALAAILLAINLFDTPLVGAYSDNFNARYLLETMSILLTAACVPASLKLFAWVLTNKIDKVELVEALHLYRKWSYVRIAILVLPLVIGLLTYLLCLSTTGLLCAAIVLTASLFCWPSEKRLKTDLHLED